MFWLDDEPTSLLRLKGFSASSTGTKSTIKITLETNDPNELGDAIRRLGNVQKGQSAKPKPASKPRSLAAPQLALPAPGRGGD